MEAWYTENLRPQTFPKKSKLNWKQQFVSTTSRQPARFEPTTTKEPTEQEWESNEMNKIQKRAWYKSDRRNEKGKLATKRKGLTQKLALQQEFQT